MAKKISGRQNFRRNGKIRPWKQSFINFQALKLFDIYLFSLLFFIFSLLLRWTHPLLLSVLLSNRVYFWHAFAPIFLYIMNNVKCLFFYYSLLWSFTLISLKYNENDTKNFFINKKLSYVLKTICKFNWRQCSLWCYK